ncbi:TetR/AcrR family transcriptional regulator [Sansalvadorimonas verongulae]|uniref:TetR/AcrR family transcriptional regulator n=1 Tax=Sansalvadorimonas verongulae TaxID=2172824 RepID=UPI0012BB85C7|nr:TetR/AcrR family transcriptional regulator [Sansalvadorimonas verongulae]MTI15517.1 TetR/AcrR family transcriptional regulator [Sansalvadorimonas verongulae]
MTRSASFAREDILERAMDTFWRNGFEGTSLRHLEEATGLHPGSLYHHFHSKEALFCDVLNHYIENHLLSRLAHHLNHHPPMESLRLFFTTSYRRNDINEYRCGCLFVMAMVEGHRESLQPILQKAMDRLESGFASTLITAGRPVECGRTLLGSYLALQLSGNLLGNRKTLDAHVRKIFELLPA